MPFIKTHPIQSTLDYDKAMFKSLIYHLMEWTDQCILYEDASEIADNIMKTKKYGPNTMDSQIRAMAYFALLKDGYWDRMMMQPPHYRDIYVNENQESK